MMETKLRADVVLTLANAGSNPDSARCVEREDSPKQSVKELGG
jgi:hypothetical protein